MSHVKINLFRVAVSLGGLTLLTGCVGSTHALIASDTNFGVDIDTTPPQADISVGRKELAIVPGFQGGRTVPTVMGFQATTNGSLLSKLVVGTGTVFSTGHAAVLLANQKGGTVADDDGIDLDARPKAHTFKEELASVGDVVGPGEVRPLVFGTHTIFGLHIAWDGTTAAVPSELKIGFNRKEAALAPVGYEDAPPDAEHPALHKGRATVPSTLATLDTTSNVGTGASQDFSWVQWFATGRAAEHLAVRDDVRKAMLGKIEPQTIKSNWDKSSDRLAAWLNADPKQNGPKLKQWMKTNQVSGDAATFVTSGSVDSRNKAITDLNVP